MQTFLLILSLALGLEQLPSSIHVEGEKFHVQGIALDRQEECLYCSFTSAFFKTDLNGEIIASVTGINGHLGALTWDPEGRKVYASLEFKDDAIGAGISRTLGKNAYSRSQTEFCIAVIDVDRINGMDVPADSVMTLVRVEDAIRDYLAEVEVDGKTFEHRYACSGIDGITIGPEFGKRRKDRRCLYVAYGIYGDVDRTDNDYNVILCYDLENLRKPVHKYFVFTGNTTWGVQNLAYDSHTDKLFLAVYRGRKESYPNYSLYSIDMSQTPRRAPLDNVPYQKRKVDQVVLSDSGLCDSATGIHGWQFEWGSTGFCPLGDGLYYISHSGVADGSNYCNAILYRWNGSPEQAFDQVIR